MQTSAGAWIQLSEISETVDGKLLSLKERKGKYLSYPRLGWIL